MQIMQLFFLLCKLCWLPIWFWVQFKILVLIYKNLYDMEPDYLRGPHLPRLQLPVPSGLAGEASYKSYLWKSVTWWDSWREIFCYGACPLNSAIAISKPGWESGSVGIRLWQVNWDFKVASLCIKPKTTLEMHCTLDEVAGKMQNCRNMVGIIQRNLPFETTLFLNLDCAWPCWPLGKALKTWLCHHAGAPGNGRELLYWIYWAWHKDRLWPVILFILVF